MNEDARKQEAKGWLEFFLDGKTLSHLHIAMRKAREIGYEFILGEGDVWRVEPNGWSYEHLYDKNL